MSSESRRHATLPAQRPDVPHTVSASARGSTSSMTLELRQATSSFSSGSVRQSVRYMLPRPSATRNSLLVLGCAATVVSGKGKLITYAVGCARGGGDSEGEPGEAMFSDGFRSQTMSILSSGGV